MFKRLVSALEKLARKKASMDPSYFNDPLAMETAWSPAAGGGTNFKTHNLIKIDDDRLEYKTAAGAKVFYGVFLFTGLLFPIIFGAFAIGDQDLGVSMMLMPLGMGLIFAGVGGGLWYRSSRPIVFDKISGDFWKGRKTPNEVYNKQELKYYTPLDEIHALQIISEYVGGKTKYYSYELNVVLKNAERINVVDHGKYQVLAEDAERIAAFLKVPVWDGVRALAHFQDLMDRESNK